MLDLSLIFPSKQTAAFQSAVFKFRLFEPDSPFLTGAGAIKTRTDSKSFPKKQNTRNIYATVFPEIKPRVAFGFALFFSKFTFDFNKKRKNNKSNSYTSEGR